MKLGKNKDKENPGKGKGNKHTKEEAAEEPAELLAFLNENGNAAALPDTLGVTARYDADMRPDPAGELRVDVCCTVEENSLVQGHIQVFLQGRPPSMSWRPRRSGRR